MQAIILAGGKGTRLKPYTTVLPKPLMPVGDYPILEIILFQLKKAGVSEIILAVGHMSHLFEAFFQDGKRFGLKLKYSFEEKPLGTAGPIALVIEELKDDFIVMNGDLLTTLNYKNLLSFHKKNKAAATISVYKREVNIDLGVVEIDHNQSLKNYIEKPTYKFDVSMGINIINPDIVRPFLTPGEYLDLPDLMIRLRDNGFLVSCYNEPCYWLDIGRLEDYQIATKIFEERKSDFFSMDT